MLSVEKTEVMGIEGAIRGMRNPKNSWDRSDSHYEEMGFTIGEKDMELATKLIMAGSEHSKFMRMIHVQADVTAPFYWWKEYDTYKVATVANSCSTMHKITERKLSVRDFSTEHLTPSSLGAFTAVLNEINSCIEGYNKTKNKATWWQIIQLLPESYNQKRTIDLDYATLLKMYRQRNNHKLDEWHTFCDWILSLPRMAEFLEAVK